MFLGNKHEPISKYLEKQGNVLIWQEVAEILQEKSSGVEEHCKTPNSFDKNSDSIGT